MAVLKRVWAGPCSVLGLLLWLIAWPLGARARLVDGVLEVALSRSARGRHRWSSWLPFHAITLGHVVVGLDAQTLSHWRAHERVHVAQYERLGPIFLVAYPLSSVIQWLRGRPPYWSNHFEVQARERSERLHSGAR